MPDAACPAELVIDHATQDDWATVVAWAADEGWNPGRGDVSAFFAQDPEGFFLGRVGGEPATAVSVVNYGPEYAFLGFYLVRPDLRGRGLGLATWRTGLEHAGDRVVGLDGVVAQQHNYRRSGFELAYRTARFAGVPQLPPPDGTVRALLPADIPNVRIYDSSCIPADRPALLAAWLSDPTHRTVVRIVDGVLTGFGTIRPAKDSPRIGPLFADTVADARQLLPALADGAEVAIDVPLCNEPAVALAQEAGLQPSFETARMYTGPVRNHHQEKVFGVTTLELG
jgi:GNAT superfamily N-acetyltransferase